MIKATYTQTAHKMTNAMASIIKIRPNAHKTSCPNASPENKIATNQAEKSASAIRIFCEQSKFRF
jgi:hypothetical protein